MQNVRNWWIETETDGRKTIDATGPHGKGDGFTTDIYQRHNSAPYHVATIHGSVDGGSLSLVIDVATTDRETGQRVDLDGFNVRLTREGGRVVVVVESVRGER